MSEQHLKMADAFAHDSVEALERHIYAGHMSKHCCEYAAHAINSHDELVRQRDELLASLKALLSSKAEPGLFAGVAAADNAMKLVKSIEDGEWVGSDHSPDAGKMVPDGCHASMTLDEAIAHAYEKSMGDSQCAAQHAQLAKWLTDYRAMLSAAPKLGGE